MLEAISLSEQIHALALGLTIGTPGVNAYNELLMLSKRLREEINEEKDKRRNYAHLVRDMRQAQSLYFKCVKAKAWDRSKEALTRSKALEADVDRRTVEIIKGTMQPKLF